MTPARWARRLCSSFFTTRATPPLMERAARRFGAQGRDALRRWAQAKARQERGHHALALRDLEAMGYDAAATVRTSVPAVARSLVEYFERTIEADDPVGCVGYAHALERQAMTVDATLIERIDACMPLGVRATRCLRVHSGVGGQATHVDETVAVVATLSARERGTVAGAVYETAALSVGPGAPAPAVGRASTLALGEWEIPPPPSWMVPHAL